MTNNTPIIRAAVVADLPQINRIYEKAIEYMIGAGNPNQWKKGYPGSELILSDIENGNLYVGLGENNEPHFVFYFYPGADEEYEKTAKKTDWKNKSEAYAVIHRVASDGALRGVFKNILSFCQNRAKAKDIYNLRMDTHKENKSMQQTLEKNGFLCAGEIELPMGCYLAYELAIK